MTRKRLLLGAGLVGLAALSAHLVFWYGGRERPATPSDAGLAPALLADDGWDWVVWLPYPHQNFAALVDAFGDPRPLLVETAEAIGRRPPRIPGFGPFELPPARELVAAADEATGCFFAEADVYPAVALLARVAGRLAKNAWLSGGEVAWGGRAATVGWEGRRWRVSSCVRGVALVGSPPDEARRPTLALVRLGRAAGPFPPAIYSLRRDGSNGGLELVAGEATGLPDWRAAAGEPAVLRWLRVEGEDRATALAFWESEGALEGAPIAARATLGEATRPKLPGEGLARLVGWSLARERLASGWEAESLDREGLAALVAQAAELDAARLGFSGRPGWLMSLAPGPTRDLALLWAERLEKIPVVGTAEARRLRAWGRWLAPFSDCRELSVAVLETPPSVRLALCRGD